MVRVIGWTPTSQRKDRETTFLSSFVKPFGYGVTKDKDYPMVRSGHRCFTDNDYFYLIGGYTNRIRSGSIFKEFWAMSLATFEWRRYDTKGELPDTLASFAIVQTAPYSKSFVLFGGSGTSFGTSSSNSFYLVRVNNDDCQIESRKIRVNGTVPQPVYGHAMCAGEVPGKYYIIGGTEGAIFNFNVHALTMKPNPDVTSDEFIWECDQVTSNPGYAGRYRLEATYDEKSERLLFFGGGNSEEVFGLDKIISLHVKTRKTSELNTIPDPLAGYPVPRRCHAVVRHNRKLIISGGVDGSLPEKPVYSDVWIFDLDNYSWRKYPHSLPKAVFFHDAVITDDGWMMYFGGTDGLDTRARRFNYLFGAWFSAPRLERLALESLRNANPSMFSGLYCGNFQPSRAFDVISTFYKKGKVDEKERQIIERGKIKFHERADRSRYYLNGNTAEFVVRHQLNVQRLRRLPNRADDSEPEEEEEGEDGVEGEGGVRDLPAGIHDFMQEMIQRFFPDIRPDVARAPNGDGDSDEESSNGDIDTEDEFFEEVETEDES